MMSDVMQERREEFLRLSWLELPWDQVRQDLLKLMERTQMSQEDLAYELRSSGYRVSHGTVNNWVNGRVKSPPYDAVRALVKVFARVSVGDWAKGRLLSENPLADLLTAS